MKRILLILICLIFTTGCYNYNELENLGIASSLLIDYVDKEYTVIVEINEKNATKTYDGKGKTISEALENTLLRTSQKLYLAHLNAVMFTKNVDVENMVSYFIREPKISPTFYFLLVENNKVYENSKEDLGLKIYNILKRNNVYNFFEISQFIFNDTRDLILPFLNEDSEISSGYIFHDNVAVHEISYNEVEIYKLLDNILNSNIIASCYDGYIEVNIDEAKSSFKIENKIIATVNIKATITEYDNDLNLDDIKDVRKAEEALSEEIEKQSQELIDTLKVYNSDIFGLDTLINNKYHDIDIHWYDYDFKFKIDTNINKKGLLLS